MPEKLVLATPVPGPVTTELEIEEVFFSVKAPSIKVTYVTNTGVRETFRLVATDEDSLAQVRAALSFINQGKFMTVQGKSLLKWLYERLAAAGKAGAVVGTPD